MLNYLRNWILRWKLRGLEQRWGLKVTIVEVPPED